MTEPEPNPHLLEHTPGSWDPPFRKWIFGTLLPLLLLAPGSTAVLKASASIPLPYRGRGIVWMPAEGLMAVSWGATLIGVALMLHGRFFWRYRAKGWQHYEKIQAAGGLIAVVASAATVLQLVVQLMR